MSQWVWHLLCVSCSYILYLLQHWLSKCLPTACISGCDFDTFDELCGWSSHFDNSEIMGFEQWTGQTETEGTGPDDDFSKPGCKLFFMSLGLYLCIRTCQIFFERLKTSFLSKYLNNHVLCPFFNLQWEPTCCWILASLSLESVHRSEVLYWPLPLGVWISPSTTTYMAPAPPWSSAFIHCHQVKIYFIPISLNNLHRKQHHVLNIFHSSGGNLGAALFQLKGNQGKGWKPANVRYLGTTAVQVNTIILCSSIQYTCILHRFILNYSTVCIFQFVIVGTYGETPETDIAVDAVCITTCKGKELTKGH